MSVAASAASARKLSAACFGLACLCHNVCVVDSDAPFEGRTVAQASFTGQKAEPVRPVSRDGVPLNSQKFLGTTEFQKSYPRHEVRGALRLLRGAACRNVCVIALIAVLCYFVPAAAARACWSERVAS